MDKIKNKYKYIVMACLLLVLFSVVLSIGSPAHAYADSIGASNVLDDLRKDNSFDVGYYPLNANDYSLNIIQIAETTDNELLVYVYQPSGQIKKLSASSINISTTINDEISFSNYELQLLNSSGVFFKYLVKDLTVMNMPTRYYAISSIYRPFDKTIDNSADFENTITEITYDVSKQFCFSTINGKPYYNVVDIETITITDKFVGFVRYKDGFKLYVGACDSHFVAFNTDRPIDKLIEADVYYTKQDYEKITKSAILNDKTEVTYSTKKDDYAYLKDTDLKDYKGSGLGAGSYSWKRIETVEQFMSESDKTQNVYSGAVIDVNLANKITDEGKNALAGKKWVLRFAETSYKNIFTPSNGMVGSYNVDKENGTLVGDVAILRLKFETDGIMYNLGVIDNKQTGSSDPINNEEWNVSLTDGGKWFLGIVLIILLIVVLSPILTLPFKLIDALFKSISKAVKRK